MTGDVGPQHVARIPPATAQELLTLEQAASQSSAPTQDVRVILPPGWRPAPGMRVTAVWKQVLWYSGTIVSVAHDHVVVSWDDGPNRARWRCTGSLPGRTGAAPLPVTERTSSSRRRTAPSGCSAASSRARPQDVFSRSMTGGRRWSRPTATSSSPDLDADKS